MKIFFVMLFMVSCSSAPLSENEKSVRILRNGDAPASCAEKETLQVQTFVAATNQGREDELKRKAYAIGADTVVLSRLNHNNFIEGVAFKCN